MPVKIYIGRDIQKFTHYPDTSHEARGVRQICEYLWDVWHHRSTRYYAIVANPKQTKTGRELSADLAIISELGLGVVELKDSYNEIKCGKPGAVWKAGPKVIAAGSENNGFVNPHQQVQAYAKDIRHDLIATHSFPGEPWDWEKFELHTAVCFTNPGAEIEKCQKAVNQKYWQDTELAPWEKFAVLSYQDVREWGADLRFNVNMGEAYGHRPFNWTPEQVYSLATDFFGARLWIEMRETMPPDRPLAYLTVLEEGKRSHLFSISHEVAALGRAPECHVLIPEQYKTVSRNHALITRTIDGFVLEDKSKNGTYVNNCRLGEGNKYLLQEDDVILLGGLKEDKEVCCLKYSRKPPSPLLTTFEGTVLSDH